MGFNIGTSFFYRTSNTIIVGCRVNYYRWFPNGKELIKYADTQNFSDNYKLENTSGGKSIIEISPSMRIRLQNAKNNSYDLDIIFGAGVYIVNPKMTVEGSYNNSTISTTWEDGTVTSTIHTTYSGGGWTENTQSEDYPIEKEIKPGLYVGLSFVKENGFEILPMCNVIFTKEGITAYVSLNFGFALSK